MRAVFFGDPALDRFYSVPFWPISGDKVEYVEEETLPGGAVANVAAQFSYLGGDSYLYGVMSGAPSCSFLLEDLQMRGINLDFLTIDPGLPEPVNYIFSCDGQSVVFYPDRSTQRYILSRDALGGLSGMNVLMSTVEKLRMVENREDLLTAVLNAQNKGMVMVLDLDNGEIAPLDDPFVMNANVVVLNEHGARRICRERKVTDEELPFVFDGTVIVTRGALGVDLYEHGQPRWQCAGIDVEVVDATGAGDAFVGSLCFVLAQGGSLQSALEEANRQAALRVCQVGARPPLAG